MPTQIRSELSKSNKYYLPKHRRLELKHFVQQFPEWEEKINSIDSFVRSHMDPAGRINDLPGDGTVDAVLKRAEYVRKRTACLSAAKKTDPIIGDYILKAVINNESYDKVKARLEVPCCKDSWYDLYHKFFWLLDQARE